MLGNFSMTLVNIMEFELLQNSNLNIFLKFKLQSIVVGFLASLVSCTTELFLDKFKTKYLLVLIGTSVTTAFLATLILGLYLRMSKNFYRYSLIFEFLFYLGGIIMFIIIASHRFNINPDNIATPIASSLGDFHLN